MDLVVCRVGVWHKAHPMALKMFLPRAVDVFCGPGAGGAERRMNPAKFTVSEEKSAAGLMPGVAFRLVWSSGVPLNTQPGTALRSLGNTSLLTPCSTL